MLTFYSLDVKFETVVYSDGTKKEQIFDVEEQIMHPLYNRLAETNNVGLLKLNESIRFNSKYQITVEAYKTNIISFLFVQRRSYANMCATH